MLKRYFNSLALTVPVIISLMLTRADIHAARYKLIISYEYPDAYIVGQV